MRGELDWIVMKALEKDRSRRYETANGLRDGYASATWQMSRCWPVRHRPGIASASSARRNRTLLATTGAILLFVVLSWNRSRLGGARPSGPRTQVARDRSAGKRPWMGKRTVRSTRLDR